MTNMNVAERVQDNQDIESKALHPIAELENKYSAKTYRKRNIVITHGEGPWVYDTEGKRYLDCISGIGASILGARHQKFSEALKNQIDRIISVPELLCNEQRARYQEELLQLFPPGYNRVFLCNGGSEANEAALKFARVSSGKSQIVALNFSYHGKTLGSLSVTHNIQYREPFEPLYKPVHFAAPTQQESFQHLFENESTVPGAFIFEAIQGEAGVREHPRDFIRNLAEQTQTGGGFVIADEVQCGFGRTGEMWGFQQYGVTPDFVVIGKGIGNGFPLAAVVLHERVPEVPQLAHTTTYGGNPLACVAGRAVIRAFQEEDLLARVRERGEQFRILLEQENLSLIREVRGQGLMIGLELKQKAGPYLAPLQDAGVLALLAGPRVLRFLPPFVIQESEIAFLVEQIAAVLRTK